ncbi:MAG: hypothetical protein ACMUIL_14085 [bacterium]
MKENRVTLIGYHVNNIALFLFPLLSTISVRADINRIQNRVSAFISKRLEKYNASVETRSIWILHVFARWFLSKTAHVHWAYCAYVLLHTPPFEMPGQAHSLVEKQPKIRQIIDSREICRVGLQLTQFGGVEKYKDDLLTALHAVQLSKTPYYTLFILQFIRLALVINFSKNHSRAS